MAQQPDTEIDMDELTDDSTANSSSDLVPSVTLTVSYTLAKCRLAAGFPW